MAARPLSEQQLRAALDAVRSAGSLNGAARILGIPRGTMESRWNRAKQWAATQGITIPQTPETGGRAIPPPDAFSVKGDAATLSRVTTDRIKSLADLIRVCEIDTSEWDVDRYECNKWEIGAKIGAQDDARVVVTPLFQVKAWLKRKVGLIAARAEIAALLEDAKRKMPARPSLILKRSSSGNMLEPSLPDLHIGKLAWAAETGWENYNHKTAVEVFEDALDVLLARTASYQVERIILPFGNDLLHSDTKQGTTTGGTPLDNDSRYHKTFLTARAMLVRAIDRLRSIAPVDAISVPGNHDTLSAFHLGDSIECYFHKCKDVTIHNAPTMRKYYQWGKVMLMFTHGNKGKLADYPLVMAAEQPKMFGETIHREAHTGDKHQLKVQEHHGVRVRISPALCPPDAWHAEHHFVGNARSAEAFVWNKAEGLIGTANYTVLTDRAKESAA